MTLVLAKIIKSRIFILSDTKISSNTSKAQLQSGVIKTALLSPHVAVSFSNSYELASRDIEHFAKTRSPRIFTDVVKFFEASSAATNNQYILAFATGVLVKISDGQSSRVVSKTAWIGDWSGFERFRAYESGRPSGRDSRLWEMSTMGTVPNAPFDHETVSRIVSCFELTVEDPEIDSVGGFVPILTNVNGEFRFMMRSKLFFDGISSVLGPSGNQIMSASGEENRSYRYSALATSQSGITAVAFFYPAANIGYVFFCKRGSLVADQCEIVKANSSDDFLHRAEQIAQVRFEIFETRHA